MRLFLDEAGNTGGIIDKNEKLNYGTQRHFCLAAVVAHDLQSEQLLRQKYAAFKNRFASEKELKGNSLFAKENNDALEYFLNNIIDDIHFSICLYDKKFYLASLLLFAILGERAREQFPVEYYSLVSDLSQEKDELFATFCKLTKRATKASVHDLFEYLKTYSYQHIPPAGNGLVFAVSEIQNKGFEEIFANDFLKFGSYSNRKFANLINLNALSELLEVIEIEHNCDTRKIDIVHEGLRRTSQVAVLNARYLEHELSRNYDMAIDQPCMHEFVMTLKRQHNDLGVSAMDIAKGMIDRGIHPPTMYFPLIVEEALMVEPTETEPKAVLDEAVRVLSELLDLAASDPQALQACPTTTPVGRIDEVQAARHPILRWQKGNK